MRTKTINTIISAVIIICITIPGKACTTFVLGDSTNLVFGRNLDFNIGYGHIVVNKRNIKKVALIDPPEKPIEWTSKYGSITFNMSGWELPFGGLNEKGLVIEQMTLNGSKYPEQDDRYCLDLLQWVQYQLDNSATVEEVINSDSLIRVYKKPVKKLHFLVADKLGNAVTIEFLDGKMVYHTGEALPYKVLSNSPYANSMDYVRQFSGFGGELPVPDTRSSLDRFAIVASKIKQFENQDILDYSFDILQAVSIDEKRSKTYWNVVYDIKNMTIYYKTYDNRTIRRISMSDFDFSCLIPNLYADINSELPGDTLEFKTCTYEANKEMIDKIFRSVWFMRLVPKKTREKLAQYPETITCDD